MSEPRSERPPKRITPEDAPLKHTSGPPRHVFFKYYIHDSISACRLQLIGELTESNVPELSGCWRTARTILGKRSLVLDLRLLKSVDESGKQWLAGMAQEGATYLPDGYLRDIVAGKHCSESDPPVSTPKVGLIGRIVNAFRSVRVEAAK